MGLVYDPKDAEALTNAIKASINTGEQLIESLLSGCNHLISVVNGKELSGAAYTAGKGLFEEIILPMVKKGEDALEDLKSDLSLFENEVFNIKSSPYGHKLLDEDHIKKQLEIYRTQQTVTNQMLQTLTGLGSSTVGGNSLTEMYSGMASQYRGLLNTFEDDIRKAEEQLKLLSQFDSGTSNLFTKSSESLKTLYSSMLILNDTQVNPKTGSYSLPKGVDKKWFNNMTKPYHAEKENRNSVKEVDDYDIITTYTMTYVDPASRVQHGMTVVYNETTGEVISEEGWGSGGELQASLAKYGPGMVTDIRREYAKTSYNEDMVKLQASQSKSTRIGNSISTFATSIARAKGITESLKNVTETVSGKDYNKRVKEEKAEKEKAEREREKMQRIKDLQAISSGGPAYFGN